jgi:hypothetical protein
MTRTTDFESYRLSGDVSISDLTPVELSTADALPETGTATATGPWVRCNSGPGAVHVELSDTTTPTATVVVECSNTRTSKGPVIIDTLALTAAGQGQGSVTFSGYVWVRIRVTAISGTSAKVTATYARS